MTEVRRGMVRRRAGEMPLESIETKHLVLLIRGNSPLKLSNVKTIQTEPLQLGASPLTAHPALSYTTFLGITLVLFVFYLILPKGFRFQYCGAQRRRHAKSKGSPQDLQAWIEATEAAKRNPSTLSDVLQQRRYLVDEVLDSRDEGSRARMDSQVQRQSSPLPPSTMKRYSVTPTLSSRPTRRSVAFDTSPTGFRSTNASSTHYSSHDSESAETGGGNDKYTSSGEVSLGSLDTRSAETTYTPKSWGMSRDSTPSLEAPPSPKHPAIRGTPTFEIVEETMERLKGRGIRLIAHGVQCDPKRVWIRLDEEISSVTWQTEFPRRVPTVTGDVSIVLMRGSLHKIPLPNVLYIDVGKKTTALKRSMGVSDHLCFSLLTQNGSLDLQANSSLERDALVSCFSWVLDSIHTQDWRKLYEESPPPSQIVSSAGSSSTVQHFPNDLVEV